MPLIPRINHLEVCLCVYYVCVCVSVYMIECALNTPLPNESSLGEFKKGEGNSHTKPRADYPTNATMILTMTAWRGKEAGLNGKGEAREKVLTRYKDEK